MQNRKSIIIMLFAAVIFTHCKKQTFINDTGTNYFMVHIQGSPTSRDEINATRYNGRQSFFHRCSVAANGGVYMRKYVYNSNTGLVLIRWSGYMIRKM